MALMNLKNEDLSGYTLIIPSISVANVPQLTIDLSITTYNFRKVTTIWHPAIVPSIGVDPYQTNQDEICTACELYVNKELKLAAIQLRSAIETKLALTNEQIDNLMEVNGIKPLELTIGGKYSITGGGFALKLFEILHEELRCTLLVKYVSEGDNRPDALTMLEKVFAISGLHDTNSIVFPSSWDFVFGGPPPIGIY
ncbi:hypothetical protein NQ317_010312 [Molorchus minor]|uniref:Proteasome assembly chaperone 2 n=1 Tax=Molorchus minor TaxID=1323400 RepID=A0ABQ9IYR7_9CUCU|nr:hypothetical protein NQ317_010312 [Molorchus minor]